VIRDASGEERRSRSEPLCVVSEDKTFQQLVQAQVVVAVEPGSRVDLANVENIWGRRLITRMSGSRHRPSEFVTDYLRAGRRLTA